MRSILSRLKNPAQPINGEQDSFFQSTNPSFSPQTGELTLAKIGEPFTYIQFLTI